MRFIPVLSVKSSVIFPGTSVPLRIGRAQSMKAIDAAQKSGQMILAVAQKSGQDEAVVQTGSLYSYGTLAKIESVRGNAKDGYQVVVRGVSRFKVAGFRDHDGFIQAEGAEESDLVDADQPTLSALLASLKEMSLKILELLPADTRQIAQIVEGVDDLSFLSHLCASNLEIETELKQEILETAGVKSRVLKLLKFMHQQREALEVRSEIREKLGQKLGKAQRENILREQLKAIRDELGETEGDHEKEDLRGKIESARMPTDVKKTALDELRRLESMGPNSPETHMIRNYLDLLVALPWSNSSTSKKYSLVKDADGEVTQGSAAGIAGPDAVVDSETKSSADFSDLDLQKAREVLDQEHYGLEKIKKRVLQHLAVMKLRKSNRGQIILFVGPPGVGKTSLGQSIAKALGRKFVRGSLGGVRDDAEVRGHRRTYIGAMPGRIIQGIKRAGENDPVFMLDEIDKLGRGYQGDPAAALLEVLDPEQNSTFLDHYLDVPFDLSNVFFIATANSLDTIPGPLLDRMEVIDLSGYTTAEKLHIAKNHLIPKQWSENGLQKNQLVLSDEALLRVIHGYTREAGVRDLQRKLTTICRAMAEKVLKAGADGSVKVEVGDLEEVLGFERFTQEVAERINPPGVATGLAWTPQGGEILFIEANLMPGKGQLILTGQLGDVMKESTQIALSLVRSRLAHVIPKFEFERNDIHVHVPAGAIPKDGPSAGVTMLATLASLLTGRSLDSKLAMTGELTLRGAVLPVGGIKEKVIAAHRAGIERVILARRNQKDLRDVPEEVRAALKIEFADTAADILRLALNLEASDPLSELGSGADANGGHNFNAV